MAGIVIDLSNYKDRTSARVPEGDYLVNVEDIEMGETRKGDPMMTVYLKIIGGDQDGLSLVDRLTLSERAMFRVVGFLQGFGIKTPRKRIQVDPSRIIGRKVRVEVADGEPYNGQIRSEVKSYLRIAKRAAEEDSDIDDVAEESEVDELEEKPKATRKAKEPIEDETPESQTSDDGELDLDDIEV